MLILLGFLLIMPLFNVHIWNLQNIIGLIIFSIGSGAIFIFTARKYLK